MANTLILGAASAAGRRLVGALATRGEKMVVADRLPKLPVKLTRVAAAAVPSVDVRDVNALRGLFKEHPNINTVWNFAEPLAVEAACQVGAEQVTVGGLRNVLQAMREAKVRKICFADSFFSFGAEAPRQNATARWLVENPKQDPGSEPGKRKRGCRDALTEFAREFGGDARFAVLPGLLHSGSFHVSDFRPTWKAVTEYPLEAMQHAARGGPFVCPIDPDLRLPMAFADDLLQGLIALMDAEEGQLREPEKGYAIQGLSFTPAELFKEIRLHMPEFQTSVEVNPELNKLARLWPESLSGEEALRDLGYAPKMGLRSVVERVMGRHMERNAKSSAAFRAMDKNGNGTLDSDDVKDLLYGMIPEVERAADPLLGPELVERALKDIDVNADGQIGIEDFTAWSRSNTLGGLVHDFLSMKAANRDAAKHSTGTHSALGRKKYSWAMHEEKEEALSIEDDEGQQAGRLAMAAH